ncbi:DNA endonuclease SmrA [Saccharophagus degradans]|uniref:DNA endonuclease SmrA n=1 Tax=Saccharophagus degradans TaxID=86304 RepID=UPI001C0A3AF9|nr:DNA endonuclease SmrA [Saccharophagus degradans]MBU2986090.1 DNA endonuclease SmrA [Saccharophagus degradans]
MNDDDAFSSLLGDDVTPLKVEPRVELKRNDNVDKQPRRQAAQEQVENTADPLASEPVEMVDPLDVLSFMRPGVQHGVFRNLRLGKYASDARLDLHRMTVDEARRAVYQFIRDCLANDVRAALITHGKGEGRAQPALLKSCIAYWLPQLDEVLAFHTALKQHGGYGATYVLIRKSELKKQKTREQHTKKLY